MKDRDREITRMARQLAEADGNDPDALMFNVALAKVYGREGYYVPAAEHTFPVWRSYIGLARDVVDGGGPVQATLFEAAE